MSEKLGNLTNGLWRLESVTVSNVNPSDTRDIVGEYARASGQDTEAAILAARTEALCRRALYCRENGLHHGGLIYAT